MPRLFPRPLMLSAFCALLLALPLGAQEPLSGEEVRALVDLDDVPGTIAKLEAARRERGLGHVAEATLGGLYVEIGEAQKAFDILEPLAEEENAPAAVLYNTFRAAALLGHGRERLMLLQRATELEPLSPAGRLMGLMMGQKGAYAQSLQLLKPWARAFPDDHEARIAAAAAALQLERAPDAEELLADLPQDSPRVRLLWGRLLVLQGDPYGALATLKTLPEDVLPALDLDRRRTMAQAYTLTGQAAEAAKLLEDRAGSDPGLALLLSHAQFQSGNVAASAKTLQPFAEAVLAEEGGAGSVLAASLTLEYGQLLNSLGRQLEALPFLERSSSLNPDDKLVWQQLGQSLNAAGRRDEARTALERFREMTENEVPAVAAEAALRADVGDPTGRNLRQALKLLSRNRLAEALRIVRDEIPLAPDDIRPRLVEARILVGMGLLDEGLSSAESAVELDPSNADARYQRGVTHMARQELEKAEADFRSALSLAADHTATMNDLAVLLMSEDRLGEARELLQRVLEIHPDDQLAASNLAKLDAPR